MRIVEPVAHGPPYIFECGDAFECGGRCGRLSCFSRLGADPGSVVVFDHVRRKIVEGTARAYEPVGPLAQDGRWNVQTTTTAPYRTRVLVRRPRDPAKFNGVVEVEWLNVSGGLDAAPDFQTELVGTTYSLLYGNSGGLLHVGDRVTIKMADGHTVSAGTSADDGAQKQQ